MVNMEVYSLFIKWLGAIQRESGERGPVSHDGAIILLLQKLVIGPIFDYIRVCILLCSALTRSVNSCKTCMGQLESDECETRGNVVKKRTHDESNRDESLSSSKRRRLHDGNDKSVTTKVIDTPAEAVQVVRSVSPVER